MTRSKKLLTLLLAMLLLAVPTLALADENGGTTTPIATITVTPKAVQKTYDGTEQSVASPAVQDTDYAVEITNGALAAGHKIKVELSGSKKSAGTKDITATCTVVDTNNGNADVTSSYEIKCVEGIKLTIKPRPIQIQPKAVSAVYDGQPHGAKEAACVTDGGLVNNHQIDQGSVVCSGEATDVTGSNPVASKITALKIFTKNGTDEVTSNYDVEYLDGKIEITPVTEEVTVTVEGEKKSVGYTGSEQTAGYKLVSISNSLYQAENIGFAGGAKGTDAGTYKKTLTAADFTNKSANFTNVKFVVQEDAADSELTITAAAGINVTIKGKTTTKVYNGAKQTYAEFEAVADSDLYKAEYITYKGKGAEGTDASTTPYPMGLKAADFENKNENFANVTFTVAEDGSMTIDPRPITVAPKAASKVYDGTPLKATEAEITSETKLVSGHVLTVGFAGEKTHVLAHADDAQYSSINSVKIMDGETDVTANYDITVGAGTLTVTPRAIALASGSATKKYDGTALKNDTITASNTFVKDDTAACTVTGTQTYGGTSDNTFTYTFKAGANSPSLESDYAITPVYGKLIVTPRAITLTSGSSKKTYDGKKLVNTKVEVGGDGLAKGDTIGIKETDTIYVYDFASKTKVGKVKNEFRYKFLNDNYKNSYDVTVKYGELKVSASGSSTQTGVDDHWPMLLTGSAVLLAASAAIVIALKKKTRRNDG